MITILLSLLPLLLAPSPGQQSAARATGTWEGSYSLPGASSSEAFTLGLSTNEAGELEGALLSDSIGNALVEADWIDERQVLKLRILMRQDGTAEAELVVQDDAFEGTLSSSGLSMSIQGTRVSKQRDPSTYLLVRLPAELPRSISLRGLKGTLESGINECIEREVRSQNLVGLSVAFVVEGKLTDIRSWGWEDFHGKALASGETMYRWASVSKLLTSVLALQLEGAEKLDLDADVRLLVPEFPKKRWPVSARRILQHQSGIVHYQHGPLESVQVYSQSDPFRDRIASLDKFKESPLLFEPGTRFSYSTHAFVLLGAVLERAGGSRFRDQIHASIAKPLGMSSFRPDYVDDEIAHRAVGYKLLGQRVIRGGDSNIAWKLPGGGFISNVGDMARFGLGMIDCSLLSPEEFEYFREPQSTSSGVETKTGLGVRLGAMQGVELLSHSGSQTKTATYLVTCPELGAAIALMSNSENANLTQLGNELMGMLILE